MKGRLAILAGDGALPVLLAKAEPTAFQISFAGVQHQLTAAAEHRFEKLGAVFDALRSEGVSHVVFAGSMARPPLDPSVFDDTMIQLAPRLLAAMQGGDDTLLRLVIETFEEQGFRVVGAHEIIPELTAKPGHLAGPRPTALDERDATRAADILMAMSPLDVGQGAVVAGGLCLGIETVQGTDALLRFVSDTPAKLRRNFKGIYVKASKRGQDLRVDMPAIGPDTVENVAKAGLAGVVIESERVLILDREKTLQAVEDTGLFLVSWVL